MMSVWGRLLTCGGLATRLVRRLPIGAQDIILPHMTAGSGHHHR